jgi:hypothetical protein
LFSLDPLKFIALLSLQSTLVTGGIHLNFYHSQVPPFFNALLKLFSKASYYLVCTTHSNQHSLLISELAEELNHLHEIILIQQVQTPKSSKSILSVWKRLFNTQASRT